MRWKQTMELALRGCVVTRECAASWARCAAKFCMLYCFKYKKKLRIILFKTNFTYTYAVWG